MHFITRSWSAARPLAVRRQPHLRTMYLVLCVREYFARIAEHAHNTLTHHHTDLIVCVSVVSIHTHIHRDSDIAQQ